MQEHYTAQKIKSYIKDFFSKCDQIRSFLRIWSGLLKKSLTENFIICAVICINTSVVKIKFNFSMILQLRNSWGKASDNYWDMWDRNYWMRTLKTMQSYVLNINGYCL